MLAATIDADDHRLSEYHIYELVSDLGDDGIEDLMEELVLHGLGKWIRESHTYVGGERSLGRIRPAAAGRRALQTDIDREHHAR